MLFDGLRAGASAGNSGGASPANAAAAIDARAACVGAFTAALFDVAVGFGQRIAQDEARILVGLGGASVVASQAGQLLRLLEWSDLPPTYVHRVCVRRVLRRGCGSVTLCMAVCLPRLRRLVTLVPTLSEAIDTPMGSNRHLLRMLKDLPRMMQRLDNAAKAQSAEKIVKVGQYCGAVCVCVMGCVHATYCVSGYGHQGSRSSCHEE